MKSIKYYCALAIMALCLAAVPAAFSYDMDEFKVLESAEIAKLTDTEIMDTYIDVIVELEAGKAFHTTSGFKPNEYKAYKDLLRYRIRLLMEMNKRGLEAPSLNP